VVLGLWRLFLDAPLKYGANPFTGTDTNLSTLLDTCFSLTYLTWPDISTCYNLEGAKVRPKGARIVAPSPLSTACNANMASCNRDLMHIFPYKDDANDHNFSEFRADPQLVGGCITVSHPFSWAGGNYWLLSSHVHQTPSEVTEWPLSPPSLLFWPAHC
jgi:hypothetical protein